MFSIDVAHQGLDVSRIFLEMQAEATKGTDSSK